MTDEERKEQGHEPEDTRGEEPEASHQDSEGEARKAFPEDSGVASETGDDLAGESGSQAEEGAPAPHSPAAPSSDHEPDASRPLLIDPEYEGPEDIAPGFVAPDDIEPGDIEPGDIEPGAMEPGDTGPATGYGAPLIVDQDPPEQLEAAELDEGLSGSEGSASEHIADDDLPELELMEEGDSGLEIEALHDDQDWQPASQDEESTPSHLDELPALELEEPQEAGGEAIPEVTHEPLPPPAAQEWVEPPAPGEEAQEHQGDHTQSGQEEGEPEAPETEDASLAALSVAQEASESETYRLPPEFRPPDRPDLDLLEGDYASLMGEGAQEDEAAAAAEPAASAAEEPPPAPPASSEQDAEPAGPPEMPPPPDYAPQGRDGEEFTFADAEAQEEEARPGPPPPGNQACMPSHCHSRRQRLQFIWDDGTRLLLFRDGRAEQVEHHGQCHGFLFYLADYPESDGLGVLSVPGSVKYADALARKRLEERGELTPDSVLHVYHKQKGSADEALLLYQVVPKARHQELLRLPARHHHGMALFDTLAMLRGIVMRLPTHKVQAVAMRINAQLLLYVGKGQQPFLARRYTLLGEGEESLRDVLFTIQQDLEMIRGQLPEMVDTVCLVEPLDTQVETPFEQPEELKLRLERWPLEAVEAPEGPGYSALPKVVRCLPLSAGIGVGQERIVRPLERLEPLVWALLALVILVTGGGAFFLLDANNSMRAMNADIEQQLQLVERSTPELANLPENSVAPFLALADMLDSAANAPSMARVWSALSAAKPSDVCIERVAMDYGPGTVQVDLQANIAGGLARTQLVQMQFIAGLEQAGFTVQHRTLSLENEQQGEFSLHLQHTFDDAAGVQTAGQGG